MAIQAERVARLPSEDTSFTKTSQPEADQRQWRQYIPSKKVYELAISDNDVWMLTEAGLFHFDLTSNQVTDYAHQNWHKKNLSIVYAIAVDDNGRIWFGTDVGLGALVSDS